MIVSFDLKTVSRLLAKCVLAKGLNKGPNLEKCHFTLLPESYQQHPNELHLLCLRLLEDFFPRVVEEGVQFVRCTQHHLRNLQIGPKICHVCDECTRLSCRTWPGPYQIVCHMHNLMAVSWFASGIEEKRHQRIPSWSKQKPSSLRGREVSQAGANLP